MRITKNELLTMAQSRNPEDRKRAFKIYQTWIKAESSLPFQDRLNSTERYLLNQVFVQQKMKVGPRAP
jgi:hypothetical protein